MKKIAIVSLVVLMLAAFAGCSGGSASGEGKTTEPATQETTALTTAAPTEAKAAESGKLGDYDVSIKSSKLAKDYEGNPAIIITYSFKNNSDKAASFTASVSTKAFQDGVELEPGISIKSGEVNAQDSLKEIKPGGSIEIKKMYKLSNQKSDVEAEASEYFSLDDNATLKKVFVIKK